MSTPSITDEAGSMAIMPTWLVLDRNVSSHAKNLYLHLSTLAGGPIVIRPTELANWCGLTPTRLAAALDELADVRIIEYRVDNDMLDIGFRTYLPDDDE